MGKPRLKNSFEELIKFVQSNEGYESLEKLSIYHQLEKSLNKKE